MTTGLSLTFSGLTVNFRQFRGLAWPRTYNPDSWPAISYTAYSTPQRRGVSYFPYFLLEVEGLLSDVNVNASGFSDAVTFDAIVNLYAASPGPITVNDYSRLHIESTARTQAIASGETANTSGSLIAYPPQFQAEFSGPPARQERAGSDVAYSFTLTQTGVIAP